jgi:hypothetical protein
MVLRLPDVQRKVVCHETGDAVSALLHTRLLPGTTDAAVVVAVRPPPELI